jgi:hypothetical protein
MKNPKMRSIMPTWSAKKMWEIRHAKSRHTVSTPTNKITVARSDETVIEWMRPVASKKSPVTNCAIAQATATRMIRRKPRPAPRRAERKITAMTNKSRRVMCTAVSYLAVECRRRIKEQVLVFLPGVQRGFGRLEPLRHRPDAGVASQHCAFQLSQCLLDLADLPKPSPLPYFEIAGNRGRAASAACLCLAFRSFCRLASA